MIFHELPLIGAWLVELEPHRDGRGMFARVWCREEFERQGLVELARGRIRLADLAALERISADR